jgi:hypothetical protein
MKLTLLLIVVLVQSIHQRDHVSHQLEQLVLQGDQLMLRDEKISLLSCVLQIFLRSSLLQIYERCSSSQLSLQLSLKLTCEQQIS